MPTFFRSRIPLGTLVLTSAVGLLASAVPANAQTPTPTPPAPTAPQAVPSFGGPVPFAPVASPEGAVTISPSTVRICTPYMLAADLQRQNHWWAEADSSGTLTVTIALGIETSGRPVGSPTGPWTAEDYAFVAVYDQADVLLAFKKISMPLVSPPANTDSVSVPSTAGGLYHVVVSGRPPQNLPPPYIPPSPVPYRLKFDGAAQVGQQRGPDNSGPRSVGPFGSTVNGSRWVMNVAPGESLAFGVYSAPPPYPPSPMPVRGTFVRVLDPNGQERLPTTQVASTGFGSNFEIPADVAGALPGPWVVVVVQPDQDNRSPYKLHKAPNSTDPGVYSAWFTDGHGSIELIVNSPPAVTSVDLEWIPGFDPPFPDAPPPTSIPTNTPLRDDEVTVGTGHIKVTPPPGWKAVPAEVEGAVTCGAHTQITFDIQEAIPPIITQVTPSRGFLWPPDHKMVPVSFAVAVTDNLDPGPVCSITGIASNEPLDGMGDGNTPSDWNITGPLTVELRAERSGGAAGRVYTATIACVDASGNRATATSYVTVAHDLGK